MTQGRAGCCVGVVRSSSVKTVIVNLLGSNNWLKLPLPACSHCGIAFALFLQHHQSVVVWW